MESQTGIETGCGFPHQVRLPQLLTQEYQPVALTGMRNVIAHGMALKIAVFDASLDDIAY